VPAHSHLVWDWNGTLLDDLPIVIDAVNRSIGAFGVNAITADDYRDHYTRPVRHFYDRIFARPITDEEWLRLNAGFHEAYFEAATHVELAPGAREAMHRLSEAGWTQSLLSMSPHDWLEGIVERLAITETFEMVDGLSGPTGGAKAIHLEEHLDMLEVPGESVVVVGDTPDDVAAARHVGARAILFHGGSHHMEVLVSQGVPIAETIEEAVELALVDEGSSPR
jgi:phosphoglycolate phosphatase-like HAD superfamily hydrolase